MLTFLHDKEEDSIAPADDVDENEEKHKDDVELSVLELCAERQIGVKETDHS